MSSQHLDFHRVESRIHAGAGRELAKQPGVRSKDPTRNYLIRRHYLVYRTYVNRKHIFKALNAKKKGGDS